MHDWIANCMEQNRMQRLLYTLARALRQRCSRREAHLEAYLTCRIFARASLVGERRILSFPGRMLLLAMSISSWCSLLVDGERRMVVDCGHVVSAELSKRRLVSRQPPPNRPTPPPPLNR